MDSGLSEAANKDNEPSPRNSFMRTLSIARPSFQYDALTDDDLNHGYIEKQSPSFLKRWQKRYFVLERKMIKYFKT